MAYRFSVRLLSVFCPKFKVFCFYFQRKAKKEKRKEPFNARRDAQQAERTVKEIAKVMRHKNKSKRERQRHREGERNGSEKIGGVRSSSI